LILPDIEAVVRIVAETAAEEVMPRFAKLARADITEKRPGDIVTVADVAAEQRLTARLSALVPGSLVVGEESVAADAGVLARLAGDDPVWVIDPIDGTANYAAGIPIFAVMVAFVRGGRTLAGWIHDPVAASTAVAVSGEGAWMAGSGARLHVAPAELPESMSGAVALRYGNRRLVRRIAGRSNLVGSVFSFRCAGHEYLALASGRAHFALYQRLMPWDHAPGQLIHKEAGGFSAQLDCSPYSPRVHDGGLLLAPDEASWNELLAVLIGGENREPNTRTVATAR